MVPPEAREQSNQRKSQQRPADELRKCLPVVHKALEAHSLFKLDGGGDREPVQLVKGIVVRSGQTDIWRLNAPGGAAATTL
jgi:hypothetical protein